MIVLDYDSLANSDWDEFVNSPYWGIDSMTAFDTFVVNKYHKDGVIFSHKAGFTGSKIEFDTEENKTLFILKYL